MPWFYDQHETPWEREQHEYRERKSDSVDAAWFLFLLMLGAVAVAVAKCAIDAVLQ